MLAILKRLTEWVALQSEYARVGHAPASSLRAVRCTTPAPSSPGQRSSLGRPEASQDRPRAEWRPLAIRARWVRSVQMLLEERDRPPPGELRGLLVVARGRVVVEPVIDV